MDNDAAIASFTEKFPIDERAMELLGQLSDDLLQRVLKDFRPKDDGNPDYSRQLMGFLKGIKTPRGDQIEEFLQTYPVDSKASDFLKMAPGKVQQRVIDTFKPPGVEDDYSRILTTHIKYCLSQHKEQPAAAHGAWAGKGGQKGPRIAPRQTDQLDYFLRNYPVDSRASDYLKRAPAEVQQRVIDTFKPPGKEDDYSRILTTHIRYCLGQHKEGAGSHGTLSSGPPRGVTRPRNGTGDDELQLFRTMYPMDDKAFEYLKSSTPDVQERVTDTFKVPEQDDYSRAITAHVKFCRNFKRQRT